MNWKKLLVLVLMTAMAGGLYYHFRPTDEKQIRKQLASLAERVSKNAGESTALMALKLQGLDILFAAKIEVDLNGFHHGNGVYQPEELSSLVARLRPGFHSIQLTCTDVQVTVTSPDSATTTFTARLLLEDTGGNRAEDIREVTATLIKLDKRWGFSRFKENVVMER